MDVQQKIVTGALLLLAVMLAQMVLAGEALATDTGDPNKHSNLNQFHKWEDGSGDVTYTDPDPYAADQEGHQDNPEDGGDGTYVPVGESWGDEHPSNGSI